jgi:transcription elongation factor GreA
MADDTTKMTAAAHEQLKARIAALEGEGRREMAGRIKAARELGDLKENAEYHAAKDEASMLEAKIARLRDQLGSAEIVEAAEGGERAGMGSTVTFSDEASGKETTYKLVPGLEAKPADGLLSIDSPVGRALAGSKAGELRTLETPKGTRTMRIVAVSHR